MKTTGNILPRIEMKTTGNILPRIEKIISTNFKNADGDIWKASKNDEHATGVLVFTTPVLSVMVPVSKPTDSHVFT
jgi:hypothetical protein